MKNGRYKIGQVAKKFGISIRLLRYYDSIELLQPTFKDKNGYRYYEKSDLLKLEKILLLQMLNFSLQEIKELFDTENISEELLVQEEFISNKISYLSQILTNIKTIRNSSSNTLNEITSDVKQIYSVISDRFHDEKELSEGNADVDQHNKVIYLLRKLLDTSKDETKIYNEILQIIPGLNDSKYNSRFFTLLRLSKSNRFKLDEIDQIEKKIIKIRLSLDTNIM